MLKVQVLARPRRLFYGWVIVLASFVNQTLQSGLSFQGFGTFVVPLQDEFGWSKAALGGARSMMQIESGLMDPIQGALIDRFGPRIMMALGALVFGAGFVALGFIQSLGGYYTVFVVMAVGGSIGGFLVTAVAVNNWFRRKRTFALSLAQMGLGFGGIVVVPLLVWAQAHYGWRKAAIGAGCAVWAIGIPMAMLMRHAPERYGLHPDGEPPNSAPSQVTSAVSAARASDSVDFTLREALRTRAFWLVGLGHGLSVMAVTAVTTYQFAHMEQAEGVGLSRSSAALVVTVLSAMNVLGRLVAGMVGDRFDKRYVAATGNVATAASLVVLATADTLAQAMAFGVMFGVAWGLRGPMMSSIRGDYFGRVNFGKISGTSSLLTMPCSVVGPILAGVIADARGQYRLAFIVLAAVSLLGCVMFLLAKAPAAPRKGRVGT